MWQVILWVAFFMFFFGWLSVGYFRKQVLCVLLSLELVMLVVFVFSIVLLGDMVCVSVSFYLLIFGACEASVGLSLLVGLVRLKGSDSLSVVSFVKC